MSRLLLSLPSSLLALTALAFSADGPGQLTATVLSGGPASDPTVALVAAVALLAWAGTAWLLLVAGLLLLGRIRGRGGRLAAGLSRAIAPAVVRRALAVGLGLTVLSGSTLAGATTPVAFAGSGAHPNPTSVTFDWPTGAGVVVVAPGDSLWRVAERALPGHPSNRQVATSWPTWWSANRDLIGADPHLLRPGTPLVPPVSR